MEEKTLNVEISNKIQPYLKDIDTKYVYCCVDDIHGWEEEPVLSDSVPADFHEWASTMDTLTRYETFTFISSILNKDIEKYLNDELRKIMIDGGGLRMATNIGDLVDIEYLEKRLEYILENNLITK